MITNGLQEEWTIKSRDGKTTISAKGDCNLPKLDEGAYRFSVGAEYFDFQIDKIGKINTGQSLSNWVKVTESSIELITQTVSFRMGKYEGEWWLYYAEPYYGVGNRDVTMLVDKIYNMDIAGHDKKSTISVAVNGSFKYGKQNKNRFNFGNKSVSAYNYDIIIDPGKYKRLWALHRYNKVSGSKPQRGYTLLPDTKYAIYTSPWGSIPFYMDGEGKIKLLGSESDTNALVNKNESAKIPAKYPYVIKLKTKKVSIIPRSADEPLWIVETAEPKVITKKRTFELVPGNQVWYKLRRFAGDKADVCNFRIYKGELCVETLLKGVSIDTKCDDSDCAELCLKVVDNDNNTIK
jgi:hypothetical protein